MVSDNTILACAGIMAITILEGMALSRGIDGTYLTLAVTTICTIITGLTVHKYHTGRSPK